MADYDLTGIWLNGERIIFDDAHLHTARGDIENDTWSVDVDGAHILRHTANERVTLAMTTADSRRVEGEARVANPGSHDESTKVYYDVQFDGLSKLHERR